MIKAFVGLPGSGKSYYSVLTLLNALKIKGRDGIKGRRVYTNIEGMGDDLERECIKLFCDLDDYELDHRLIFMADKDMVRVQDVVKPHSVIIIDEVHKLFNCRDWNSTTNNDFCNWASTHRHLGIDIILITQDIQKVDKQLRSLITYSHYFQKIDFVGRAVKNRFIEHIYMGDDATGKPLASKHRTYNPDVFKCYKSYVASDIQELGIGKRVNILNHWVFYLIPIVVTTFLYMFFTKSSFATGDVFGSNKALHKRDNVAAKPVQRKMTTVSAPVIQPQHQYSSIKPASLPALARNLPPPVKVIGRVDQTYILSDGTIIDRRGRPALQVGSIYTN